MSDSPLNESLDSEEIDNYADLDDFDDGAMFGTNPNAAPAHQGDKEVGSETNADLLNDVNNVKKLFGHLAPNPEIDVCRIHGDVVTFYLPFFPQLNKGLQLVWKDYEHSHIVIDIKICMETYRRAKNQPLISLSLSTGSRSPSLQLFCDHLRSIAQNYTREHFNQEKNALTGLFRELLLRLRDLSSYCCFCDRRLGDEGAFLPTFCTAPLCAFQGEEFRRAHPDVGTASDVFLHVLKDEDHFISLRHMQQVLILHESPDQISDFERRRQRSGVRFLYLQNSQDSWISLLRRPESKSLIRLCEVIRAVDSIFCEVIDDAATLIQLNRYEYLVHDLRTVRFRVRLENSFEIGIYLTADEEARLQNTFFDLLQSGCSNLQLSDEVLKTFDLTSLPDEVLLRVLQLASRRDILKLKRASKKFHDFIEANKELLMFKDIKMKVTRVTVDHKRLVLIRFDNLLEHRLMEVFVELPKQEALEFLDVTEEMPTALYHEVQPQYADSEEQHELLSNGVLHGAKEDEWRRLSFHSKGRTLREVLLQLSVLIEITRVEMDNVYASEVEVVLQVLQAIRELHIGDIIVSEKRVVYQALAYALPSSLTSLHFPATFHPTLDSFFANPQIHQLHELHIYGRGEAIPDEDFQALRVERLCLDGCEISLIALRRVKSEWRMGEREILAWIVEVVEEPQIVARVLPPPGVPGRFVPQRRGALTKEQIFLALHVDRTTSRLRRRNPGNFELQVEMGPRDTGREQHGKTLVQFLPYFL